MTLTEYYQHLAITYGVDADWLARFGLVVAACCCRRRDCSGWRVMRRDGG